MKHFDIFHHIFNTNLLKMDNVNVSFISKQNFHFEISSLIFYNFLF